MCSLHPSNFKALVAPSCIIHHDFLPFIDWFEPAGEQDQYDGQRCTDMAASIHSAVGSARQNIQDDSLKVDEVLIAESSEVVSKWQGASRLMGTRDLNVIVTCDNFSGLAKRLQELERALAYSSKSRVQNAAAQVLNAALKGFKKSTCTRFQELGDECTPVKTASKALGVSAGTFAKQADAVISRRNNSFHPSTVEELDEEVTEVVNMLTPTLKQLVNWECRIIEKYEDIKAAFPGYFQQV